MVHQVALAAEPLIDDLRLQKDGELDKLRMINERKLRDKEANSVSSLFGRDRSDKSYSRSRFAFIT
jgi:hypothetical protein